MGRPFAKNEILKIEDGVAFVDVSTKKHPGAVTKIEIGDLHLFNDGNGRWRAASSERSGPYVVRNRPGQPVQFLHRVLLGLTDPDVLADHVRSDGLDNRRSLLREASSAGNARNCSPHHGSSSKYLGVWWEEDRQCWRAAIRLDGKLKPLGRYKIEDDAGRAYDTAAKLHFSDFANLNFPAAAA